MTEERDGEGRRGPAAGVERFETVIIGGGQAGLSVGYHLARRGLPFVILDANERIGDSWRKRWDSLRLFTPARFDGLAGMPFPASAWSFPTKDEMADYLEAYAARFDLPVRTGVRVDGLSKDGDRFVVTCRRQAVRGRQRGRGDGRLPEPAGACLRPRARSRASCSCIPASTGIRRSCGTGGVLVVGAGNSGAEIALEVSRTHPTWLSGRDTGHVPVPHRERPRHGFFLPLVFRCVFHRVLTVNTPIGRKVRPKLLSRGAPLDPGQAEGHCRRRHRTRPQGRGRAGRAARCSRTAAVLDVANVIWCTGFHPGFSWIDLPVFGEEAGDPMHERGVVASEPGLYFVGLLFLYAVSSVMIHGVGRDAEHIAQHIASPRTDRPARRAGPSVTPLMYSRSHRLPPDSPPNCRPPAGCALLTPGLRRRARTRRLSCDHRTAATPPPDAAPSADPGSRSSRFPTALAGCEIARGGRRSHGPTARADRRGRYRRVGAGADARADRRRGRGDRA